MKLILELFFLKTNKDEIMYKRDSVKITSSNLDPDIQVLESARKALPQGISVNDDLFIIHSTSWRYEVGRIYLTYLVYSETFKFPQEEMVKMKLEDLAIAVGNSTIRPRPELINEHHVVSHALRHLGYLINNDSSGKYDAAIDQESSRMIKNIYSQLAGKI